MIQKIDQTNEAIAKSIYDVFQISYAVEAELLNAIDFPPLKRSVTDFIKSKTDFYGYFLENQMVAVIEIKIRNKNIHIQSLVVTPSHFRKGIAKKLIHYTFETYSTKCFSVETGLNNQPAKALYIKNGFTETKQWDTNHGIRKIRFEKRI